MKFLIVGDLHGKKPEIKLKNFDAVILPGDFCSDEGKDLILKVAVDPKKGRRKREWFDIIGMDKAEEMIERQLKTGREVLESLNSLGKKIYVIPGNWDYAGIPNSMSDWDLEREDHYHTLLKGLTNLVDCHQKAIDIGDYIIIGHGMYGYPELPQHDVIKKNHTKEWFQKEKKEYEEILGKIDKLFQKAQKKGKPVILLSHNVPFNTKLDIIKNKKSGERYGLHFGSVVARKMIERWQPLVCIGAHMHESYGKDYLGRTLLINAGFGPKVNTLLELKGSCVSKVIFNTKTRI
jgi:Icc-related predicted phosphoesterase